MGLAFSSCSDCCCGACNNPKCRQTAVFTSKQQFYAVFDAAAANEAGSLRKVVCREALLEQCVNLRQVQVPGKYVKQTSQPNALLDFLIV